VDPRAKALLAQVQGARAPYSAVRAEVLKDKAAGNLDGAKEIVGGGMADARGRYLAALDRLATLQREMLDDTAAEIAGQDQRGRNLLVGLGTLAILLGAACAYTITQSITGPIG